MCNDFCGLAVTALYTIIVIDMDVVKHGKKRQFYHADSSTRFPTADMASVRGMPNQHRERFDPTEKLEGLKWSI